MSTEILTETTHEVVLEPKEVKRLDYKAPEYFIEKVDLDFHIFTGIFLSMIISFSR